MSNTTRTDNKKLWEQRINNYYQSKLSARKYCEKNQISYHALKYWITKFNKEKQQHQKPNKVAEEKQWVNIVSSKPSDHKKFPAEGSADIQVLVGKYKILVQKGFDTSTFKEIAGILGQC